MISKAWPLDHSSEEGYLGSIPGDYNQKQNNNNKMKPIKNPGRPGWELGREETEALVSPPPPGIFFLARDKLMTNTGLFWGPECMRSAPERILNMVKVPQAETLCEVHCWVA